MYHRLSRLACGRCQILFFALGGPTPQTPRVGGLPPPNLPVGGVAGGSPLIRGVWDAGAPQSEKQYLTPACPAETDHRTATKQKAGPSQ